MLGCFRSLSLRHAALVIAGVATSAVAYGQSAIRQEQIAQHEKALSKARATKNHRRDEATELFLIARLYMQEGPREKALDYYSQALPIEREIGDRHTEAVILSDMALEYTGLGQIQKAIDAYNQALPIEHETGDRLDEATDLSRIASLYFVLGQMQQALDFYNRELSIEHGAGGNEAMTLSNLGGVSSASGQKQKAIDYYNQALLVCRKVGNRKGEAATLDSIGSNYSDMGETQKALDYHSRALSIWLKVGDRGNEAATLNNIGNAYSDLGQKEKALEYYNQALSIAREARAGITEAYLARVSEATALSNIGSIYSGLGQRQKALEYYNQALAIEREVGDRSRQAITLSNIGSVYSALGQKQKALGFYNQSLLKQREVGDRSGESYTLWALGYTKRSLGDVTDGLQNMMAALSLAETLDDPDLRGGVDASLMEVFREQKRPDVALLFGTDAVNAYQQIRRNIAGLNKNLQAGFAQSKSATYRELAELLVETDHLSEAEHVLDLLKDAEFRETVRSTSDNPTAKTDSLPLTNADRTAESGIAAQASRAADLTDASFEYDRLSALPAPTAADKAKLKVLSDKIAAGNAAMETFFNKTLYAEMGSNSMANMRVNDANTETSSLRNILANLGPGVVALYTLVGEQHSYIIVTTANTRTRYEINANAAELGKLVLAARQKLLEPTSAPFVDLNALYHLLLNPIAADIGAAAKQSKDGVPTLLWSLDGVLRYLPMNALYDGKQYLVERARNVIVTPESRNHLLDPASTSGLPAVALGLSKSYLGAPELKGVTAELNAVVHDPDVPASHGPLSGKVVPNDAFTLVAFEDSLRRHPAVVHVASHFAFRYGNAGESYLLLSGDQTGGPGYALTLSQLQTDPQLSFRGTRLLTLSACGTAEAGTTANGREIDSLGMVVQKRDAASVLATLWSVNDASTSLLMSDFYRRWAAPSGIEKVEALRQSQMAMLHDKNYAHPYFWAPFVLIGNFR